MPRKILRGALKVQEENDFDEQYLKDEKSSIEEDAARFSTIVYSVLGGTVLFYLLISLSIFLTVMGGRLKEKTRRRVRKKIKQSTYVRFPSSYRDPKLVKPIDLKIEKPKRRNPFLQMEESSTFATFLYNQHVRIAKAGNSAITPVISQSSAFSVSGAQPLPV